ncbi:MAG: VCBS repeat-containing protein [Bacteriovoracaceae bacterium]|nr:VCBS repeat-containing protein [Bacteriovoracaceae bacterium]
MIIKTNNNKRKRLKVSCLIFLTSLLLIDSCSHKNIDTKTVAPKPYNKKIDKLISGPTKKPVINQFIDQTELYGLRNIKATNLYAVDFNHDSFTDLVVLPEHFSIPDFYQFEGNSNKFIKLDYNPLPEVIRGSYLSFVDFNKDGILDLVVGTLNLKTELTKYPLRFYKGVIINNKIYYSHINVNLSRGIRPTATISLFDYNLDGHLDIFEGNWYEYTGKKSKPINDQLYQGNGFKFKNATGFLFKEALYSKDQEKYLNARPSFGVSTCDIDQNGYPDILVSTSSGFKNKLWLNQKNILNTGQRLFKDFGVESEFSSDYDGKHSPRGGGNSFYSLCTDYNNDGIMDIVVGELSHSYDTEARDRSAFLTGTRKTFPPVFLRTEYHTDSGDGGWNQGDRRGVFFDYDMDGLVDLLVDNSGFPPKSRLILFRQEENHSFADLSEALGINILNPAGTVTLDINRDGQMDFISGQTNIRNSKIVPRLYVFINKVLRLKKRSFRFHLKGIHSNSHGYGALLKLKTNKTTLTKWNETISGPLPSQNESGIYFGLGEGLPQKITVNWPIILKDKKTQHILEYSLKNFQKKLHYDLVLCEDGSILLDRTQNCKRLF